MAEHPHSEHRPPPAGQEAGFHNPEQFGVLYPEHDVVAVIDDPASARQTVGEVRALGIGEENIDLLDNARALALEQATEQGQTLGERTMRAVSRIFSDDAAYHDNLTAALHRGGSLFIAHVTDDATVRAVAAILRAHHARASRYYRPEGIEDLV